MTHAEVLALFKKEVLNSFVISLADEIRETEFQLAKLEKAASPSLKVKMQDTRMMLQVSKAFVKHIQEFKP